MREGGEGKKMVPPNLEPLTRPLEKRSWVKRAERPGFAVIYFCLLQNLKERNLQDFGNGKGQDTETHILCFNVKKKCLLPRVLM